MVKKLSKRRLAENEVFFRQPNERVANGLEDIRKRAESEGYADLVLDPNEPVQFYCECSDENCRRRIKISPRKYRDLHQNKSQFLVLPGHNVPELERIVQSTKKYMVLEKVVTPPKKAKQLHPTPIDHSKE